MRSGLPSLLLTGLLGWAGVFAALPAARAQDGGPADRTSYIARHAFFIPFQIDPSRRDMRELKLFASRDGGPWQEVARSAPGQNGFDFRAAGDGSYTFAVQAISADGTREPERLDQLRSHLRVVVDTRAPEVALRAMHGRPGTAGVAWDVRDEYLDDRSVRLEVRWPGQADWMPVDPVRGDHRPRGDFFWEMKPGQRLQVRVTARDRAGNVGESPVVETPPSAGGGDPPAGPLDPPSAGPDPGASRSHSRPRMSFVNSKRVSLETRIQVGRSGVADVKLWVKQESGEWREAPASAAPAPGESGGGQISGDGEQVRVEKRVLTYEAPDEGQYGFIVVARNGVGLASPAPRPGDPPQVLVEVDLTPPKVAITDVRVLPSGARGKMVQISWDVQDKNLDDRPVELSYAPDRGAAETDWKLIAKNLDNTGSYTWVVPDGTPYRFYLRLRAIDRAQNLGQDVWRDEVIIDLFTPRTEIIEVSPVNPQ
ncbi:MAG TPA: hypothetical protein VIL46_14180 [Gemmataceae bacterium]